MTEVTHFEHNGQEHDEERIIGWTKRLDHRHHAIDALTIACTRQGYIQRLNTLSASRDVLHAEVEKQSDRWQEKHSLLEEWTKQRPHLPVNVVRDYVDGILVSYKPGKKVATPGKRYAYSNGKKELVQDGLIIPRGALCEESVYGLITTIEESVPVKKLFENPALVFKPYIRDLIEQRIKECDGDWIKARASIIKKPIWLDKEETVALEYATCWKKEYVIRYPISSLKAKDVDSIVDMHIRNIVRKKIDEVGEKDAFHTPIYADDAQRIPIRNVRLFTGLDAVEPVKYVDSVPIGFSKPGNNHHIAIYRDKKGNRFEHVVSFWHAIERKRYGLPVIIQDTDTVWNQVEGASLPESFLKNLPTPGLTLELSLQQNEMLILGMTEDEFNDAIRGNDKRKLNKFLYKVQKLTTRDYFFRYHVEAQPAKEMFSYLRVRSIPTLMGLNPKKIRISVTGNIILEQ